MKQLCGIFETTFFILEVGRNEKAIISNSYVCPLYNCFSYFILCDGEANI